ncbi:MULTISPECIES: NAD(P)/FAD-dependent oxidoreductase [Acinetobacter]|jgi:cation diffusion facilitator CzcD-associated flavoprotein CzcO|uniref:flavoprotein n=1 Tax=Acinetobacter TaxID=469 RepID=UPI0018FFA245|nr:MULTISPECIES: flavoprotein [Acinetobacter]MBJ8554473.1 flavoprotein [Acinetobacter bereziniae]MCU4416625.1 flavoprotein [Acinetobacter bereziniae]MDA3442519.1 flavoprotein [Acinetobacter bereziniae]MDR3029927.1 flavoprotein [Acinetobacter sp.]
MLTRNKSQNEGFFQNQSEFFKPYTGKIIASTDMKLHDFSGLKVAIIGVDQFTVTQLDQLLKQAELVKVFQISPVFVLPQTERGIHKLISHPLIIKNRRLFNHRIKAMLAIRYLDAQVQDQWLKRQLTPNLAMKNKVFLKSDNYYSALQHPRCKHIAWPIVKITSNSILGMDGTEYVVDVVISTYTS